MKKHWLTIILVGLILLLQAQLWIGDGSVGQQTQLQKEIEAQREENDVLEARNAEIARDIESLGDEVDDNEGLEERARSDLGMIGEGEVFFMIVDPEPKITPESGAQEEPLN